MTLEELDQTLPNGFHDMEICSMELDYLTATARLNVRLLVGWPDDPEPESQEYQAAVLTISGLCLCSIEPPDPSHPFLPDGNPIMVSGDPAKSDSLPSLDQLSAKFPVGAWCYRFFVHDWNAFIHFAAKDAQISWVGPKPKHAGQQN